MLAPVISKVGRAAIVLALCLSLGFHWVALQSIAWTTMIVQYSQKAPLAEALAETFDGHHPCDLCKHIHSAQHSEKKPEAQWSTAKPDLMCIVRAVVLAPAAKDLSYSDQSVTASSEAPDPPVPPPRSILA